MAALTTRRRRAVTALVSGLVLALAGCSSSDEEPVPVIDLVGHHWQHMPGVTNHGEVLRVEPTVRSIVEQDGGGGQPNPPVNLFGTHLVAGGDFTLAASFADVTADASWTVYDSPPVIADEFRIEPASLRLTLRGDELEIALFDGAAQQVVTDPQPAHEQRVEIPEGGASLAVRRNGRTLEVASGPDTVWSGPLGDMFASGKLWLGLSSEEGSFTVDSLTASAPDGASLTTAGPAVLQLGQSAEGLQALAARTRPEFLIGAAVALGPLASDLDYAREFVGNFGALTPENAMKPQFLSPRQGVYTFEEADALLDVAESKQLAVHGHTIAFSEAMPSWMQELPSGSEAEREESAEALIDYVTTVVTHFRGRLASLDVVNEPFDVDQGTGLQQNIWYRVFGPDYPAVVSRAVHEADPDVAQFINENGADVPGPRQDALLELALETNARGGHIEGVGLQGHVYDLGTDAIPVEALTETLTRFDDAGLRVRISENDVTDEEGTRVQAEQYAAVLSTCFRSPACVSYTTWGVDNRYNWWVDDDGELQQGHDFVFEDGKPTPALEAMRRALGG
ncbi:endo-1,4-beta-xylanase [Arthrobacter echini]|uniref:endo-1,4-beta-xylanase n=1 Tax=Arthrobacter echini TaxID=1529066 RepID=A0A4S5E728_9MICC|nr:endo-1,4-beta-xylanase [Arthrobacter echini]THJ67354.1 endo-1,4-beta-xylanase [Arthrobacter echini]